MDDRLTSEELKIFIDILNKKAFIIVAEFEDYPMVILKYGLISAEIHDNNNTYFKYTKTPHHKQRIKKWHILNRGYIPNKWIKEYVIRYVKEQE
jgi:hypothetical protein